MSFSLKMAWRDSRASRWRLVMFSLSIVLGIGALVATGSFCENLRQAIDDQSNGLLGADVVATTFDQPTPGLLAYLAEKKAEIVDEQVFGSVVSSPTVKVAPRMVQVHTIEGNFPLYGEFVTEPASALQQFRAGGKLAILDQSLAKQFALKTGDTFLLGKESFTVAGILVRLSMSTQVEAMFMPRVYTPPQPLPAVVDGKPSRRRHMLELKLPHGTNASLLVKEMGEKFKEDRLSFAIAEDRKQALQKALPNIDRFLSLVGFVALLLGAVGVAASLHVYVRQKLATVAILRCLGARVWQGFAVYLWQGIALGVAGAVLGAAVGVGAQWLVPYLVRDFIPMRIDFAIVWPAIGRGMVAGVVMCLLFTLAPLLEVRRVSPLMAIRSAFGSGNTRAPDPWRIALGVTIVLTVVGFALLLAPVWQVGLAFAVAITVSFSVLAAVAKLVAWAAKRWFPRGAPYVARQGIANLYRPQNRTVLLLLSLGLGTFLILTLYLTRTTLLRHIEGPDGANRPNLIIEGVGEDKIDGVSKLLPENGAVVVEKIPVVQLKVTSLRGRTYDQMKGGRGQGWVNSVFQGTTRATYRSELAEGRRMVEGEFIGRRKSGDPLVPIVINQQLARVWRVKVGDEITWDAKGVPIKTRVSGIEGWEIPRLMPEFRVTFPVGVLEAAPKWFVVLAHARDTDAGVAAQRELKAAYPGLNVIDLSFFVQTLDRLFAKIAFVIEFLALSIVATGLIMLVCAVLTGRYQRIRETVLLRTIGASRRQLQQIQFIEYAILGALGAFVGCVLAVTANALLAVYLFHTTPQAPVLQVFAAFLAVIAVTLLTGWFANRGVADYPPLEVLRQET
jgi:putative ABC transport system permease protein